MSVKNILKTAIIFLGLDEILLTNIFTDGGVSPTQAEQKTVDELVRCLNLVLEEIVTEYIPITEEKEISFINKKCKIEDIDSLFCEAIKLHINGKNIPFIERDNFIIADTSRASILYKKYPSEVAINSNLTFLNRKIAPRVIAYGVSMEYSFIHTLSDEGAIWEKRYRDGLTSACFTKKEKRLPRWRW